MFRQLATSLTPPAGGSLGLDRARMVFNIHPLQLHRYLEEAWAAGGQPPPPTALGAVFLGNPRVPSLFALNPLLTTAGAPLSSAIQTASPLPTLPPPAAAASPLVAAAAPWDHLMYAYLIENTGIMRVFRRVIEAFAVGEALEVPGDEARLWLRATEELFFRDPPPFHVSSLTSSVRPDLDATRRNAYWRLFGMDLNQVQADGRPLPYVRGAGANRTFVEQWERFQSEVWQGYLNRRNSSGENSEDPEAVANHAEALSRMLQARRLQGNLAREEFFFVAMMAWFHLTVEYDTPIVEALRAQAPSPAERLRKIGERVGLPADPRSRNFFDMATEASAILRAIELDAFNTPATVTALYDNTAVNPIRTTILAVINNWSAATGRNVKLRRQRDAAPAPRRSRVPISALSAGSVSRESYDGEQ
ncbi:hypothetical protein ACVWW9_002083 [Agrococcus sp. UYP33]